MSSQSSENGESCENFENNEYYLEEGEVEIFNLGNFILSTQEHEIKYSVEYNPDADVFYFTNNIEQKLDDQTMYDMYSNIVEYMKNSFNGLSTPCPCFVNMKNRYDNYGIVNYGVVIENCRYCDSNPIIVWEDSDSNGKPYERYSERFDCNISTYIAKQNIREMIRKSIQTIEALDQNENNNENEISTLQHIVNTFFELIARL